MCFGCRGIVIVIAVVDLIISSLCCFIALYAISLSVYKWNLTPDTLWWIFRFVIEVPSIILALRLLQSALVLERADSAIKRDAAKWCTKWQFGCGLWILMDFTYIAAFPVIIPFYGTTEMGDYYHIPFVITFASFRFSAITFVGCYKKMLKPKSETMGYMEGCGEPDGITNRRAQSTEGDMFPLAILMAADVL